MLGNEIALTNNRNSDPFAVIKGLITEYDFVNIGVIKKIHNDWYVDVTMYYENGDGTEYVITDVRLLQIGTTKCKIFIQPAIGDNVLLFSPKDFIKKLEYNKKPEPLEKGFMPYGNINAVGILIKDESDDNVKTSVNIDENGNISISTDGDTDVSVKGDTTLNVDGDAKVDIGGDATVDVGGDAKLTADGDAEIDCKGATIKCSAASSLKVNLGPTTAFEVGMI